MIQGGRCPRCALRAELCLCAEIPRVETGAQIVIVRHAVERFKPSNTGRLAALALVNSRLIDHGRRDDAEMALPADAWLLWPEGTDPVGLPAPQAVVVLDASWSQARRMAQRLPELQRLRKVALRGTGTRRRMRTAPHGDAMATLEAIAAIVRVLDGAARAVPLERLYVQAVLRSVGSRERLTPDLVAQIGADPADAERVRRALRAGP